MNETRFAIYWCVKVSAKSGGMTLPLRLTTVSILRCDFVVSRPFSSRTVTGVRRLAGRRPSIQAQSQLCGKFRTDVAPGNPSMIALSLKWSPTNTTSADEHPPVRIHLHKIYLLYLLLISRYQGPY